MVSAIVKSLVNNKTKTISNNANVKTKTNNVKTKKKTNAKYNSPSISGGFNLSPLISAILLAGIKLSLNQNKKLVEEQKSTKSTKSTKSIKSTKSTK